MQTVQQINVLQNVLHIILKIIIYAHNALPCVWNAVMILQMVVYPAKQIC